MYFEFFGLSQAPFKITPHTEFFFPGGNRGAILDALIYAIKSGEGIVKVTGEVGSGKTMLCRMLQARLPQNIETVYLANPGVSAQEILYAIAFELQIPVSLGSDRLPVMHALHDYLLARHTAGKQVVIIVEEAQGMPLATLEEIRLLSNLETGKDKLLQILLFGQPELNANLRMREIRQLRERITHSFDLKPLAAEEIKNYVMFRLRTADYKGPDLFGHDAVKLISRASSGLTRRVNILADKALLAAYADNTHTVSKEHVKAAIRDSEFNSEYAREARRGMAYAAGLAAASFALGLAAYHGYRMLSPAFSPAPAAATAAAPTAPAGGQIAAAKPIDAVPAAPAAGQAGALDSRQAPLASSPLAGAAQAKAQAPGEAKAQPAAETPAAGNAFAPETKREPLAQPGQPPLAAAERAGPAAPAAAEPRDALDARLTQTEKWLSEYPPQTCSIQIMGTNSTPSLKSYFEFLNPKIDMSLIYIFATRAKGQPSMTVLYGSYPNCAAAARALQELPKALDARQPILRTVHGIRAEIAQQRPL